LDGELELHLYYIAQESVLNAVKHGRATSVIVRLASEGERMKLSVQDNGAGFDLSQKTRLGMGIRIMRYRAKMIGATLEVHSEPGRGTEIGCGFAPVLEQDTGAMGVAAA
jgi:signal transduction histidine kinase